MNLRANG